MVGIESKLVIYLRYSTPDWYFTNSKHFGCESISIIDGHFQQVLNEQEDI